MHALRNNLDDFIGDVEAEGFVEPREIVDGDDQKAERIAEFSGIFECVAECFRQAVTIEFAGELDRDATEASAAPHADVVP